MKLKNMLQKSTLLIGSMLIISGCDTQTMESNLGAPMPYSYSNNNMMPTGKLTTFYGDITNQRILGIDIESMSVSSDTPTNGLKPYTVGRADGRNGNLNKLYGVTRNSPWMEIIDLSTRQITGTVPLQHTPRSCAYNEVLGLQLVSGIDKPMSSLIDPKTDQVVATAGRNTLVTPTDTGGSNATGHPVWLSSTVFAILDREVRKIDTYKVEQMNGQWSTRFLQSISTPTSAHHFIGKGSDGMDTGIAMNDPVMNKFYVITEGSALDNIPPSVLELDFSNEMLSINRSVSFDHAATLDEHNNPNFDTAHTAPEITGGHHATFHPSGRYLYVGSKAGEVLVVDVTKMHIIKQIPAGSGSGHTTFIPQKGLGIVTNHGAQFVTIIDTTTHTKIKDLMVSGVSQNSVIMQSHTSFTDAAGDFFYAFASNNGVFYEVNLTTLEVSRTLTTGGTPVQGCFTYLP
ncbi:MAG: hypothetical protein Q9O24_03620 [Gammaproteobacteria bacterium]|nr:hypothetical protein [Gammaproteobacteria bacterium]